jgi:hypothetical protein
MTNDRSPALSPDEFDSLREVSKGGSQREIPQLHWERLVSLGYAVRRLGELGLTASIRHSPSRRRQIAPPFLMTALGHASWLTNR